MPAAGSASGDTSAYHWSWMVVVAAVAIGAQGIGVAAEAVEELQQLQLWQRSGSSGDRYEMAGVSNASR